jgi:hypothetical protein
MLSVLEKIALALGASVGDLFIDDRADEPDDNELARFAAAERRGTVGRARFYRSHRLSRRTRTGQIFSGRTTTGGTLSFRLV